jgi:hypothetical protein
MLSKQSAKIEFELLRSMKNREDLDEREKAFREGAEAALAWMLEWEGKKKDVKPSRFIMESAMRRRTPVR